MLNTNFHTHTSLCDGRDSAAALAEEAIRQGMRALGFTAHSPMPFPTDWTLKSEAVDAYLRETARLKEACADTLLILCGIEQDMLSGAYDRRFSYAIGSLHYLKKGERLLPIDESAEVFSAILREVYDGDYMALCRDFYRQSESLLEETEGDIIGHLDIVTKFEGALGLQKSPAYYEYAARAIEALLPYRKPFEINTGAMARGYKREPYPDPTLLALIKNGGGRIIFSSDCHKKEQLRFGFSEALSLAKAAGFTSHTLLNERGLYEEPLPEEA